MKHCKIKGCKNPVRARGWCSAHHNRWNRYGDPTAGSTLIGEPQKFLEKAFAYKGRACLLWPFSMATSYPRINVGNGKYAMVTRIICTRFYGPPPTPQHEAAHSCKRNKKCVNHRHLRWATPEENAADTLIHKTRVRGEQHYCAKFTEKDVRKIRKLTTKKTQTEIAWQFGVTVQNIHAIISGRSWAWLK